MREMSPTLQNNPDKAEEDRSASPISNEHVPTEALPRGFQMLYDDKSQRYYEASGIEHDFARPEHLTSDSEELLKSIAGNLNIDVSSKEGLQQMQQVLASLSHTAVRFEIAINEKSDVPMHHEPS